MGKYIVSDHHQTAKCAFYSLLLRLLPQC